jgi:putative addiction module component (TIGR02574 family)
MSLTQVIAELPGFTVSERQLLVRRAIELDEPPLTATDEDLLRNRLAEHERDPSTAIPFDEMKVKVRAAFPA